MLLNLSSSILLSMLLCKSGEAGGVRGKATRRASRESRLPNTKPWRSHDRGGHKDAGHDEDGDEEAGGNSNGSKPREARCPGLLPGEEDIEGMDDGGSGSVGVAEENSYALLVSFLLSRQSWRC